MNKKITIKKKIIKVLLTKGKILKPVKEFHASIVFGISTKATLLVFSLF